MPRTAFAHAPDDTEGVMQLVGGAPMVLKLIEGTQGEGVVLAETSYAAASLIEAFRWLHAFFLVQEFFRLAQCFALLFFFVFGSFVALLFSLRFGICFFFFFYFF